MPHELIDFIANYGYFALFILIFIQEMGIPNPVPNELVLMFSGYLTLKGILIFPYIILVTVSADLIGTSILYAVFYFFGIYILKRKPRWLPTSQNTIDKLSKRITKGGRWIIYIGRIIPFIRGYISVIAGLMQIKPGVFLPIALVSAITWSVLFVAAGRMFGPYLNYAGNNIGNMKYIIISIVLIIIVILVSIRYFKKRSTIKQ